MIFYTFFPFSGLVYVSFVLDFCLANSRKSDKEKQEQNAPNDTNMSSMYPLKKKSIFPFSS